MLSIDKKKVFKLFTITITLEIVLLAFAVFIFVRGSDVMPNDKQRSLIILELFSMLLSLFVALSIIKGRRLNSENTIFMQLSLVGFIYLFSDCLFYYINGNPKLYVLNVIDNTVYLACPIFLTYLFWHFLNNYISSEGRLYRIAFKICMTMLVMDCIIILLNLFNGMLFSVNQETGTYIRGLLFLAPHFLMSVVIFVCSIRIVANKLSLWDKMVFLTYILFPFATSLIFLEDGQSLLALNTSVCLFFMYTNIFVTKGNQIIIRERELAESRLKSLQMQINPHFMYNILTSIGSLCESNPKGAEEMVYRLSDYLHNNFTDIQQPVVITFQEELRHLRSYVDIELMRFPNIEIHYDIQERNFSLPALTLQPLVENAIKHGIRKQESRSGEVWISSYRDKDYWVVTVVDNGVGFSGSVPTTEKHIGIMNVRNRLKMLCDGTLEIESKVGEGTKCTIKIPVKMS